MEEQLTPLTTNMDTRQAARMAGVPELYRKTHERLAVELALGMENAETVFAQYGYTQETALDLIESPAFIALLARVRKEVAESGLSFRSKAKAISEELLPYALIMATDPECSAAVRADLIKWSAKVGGNEPLPIKDDGKTGGGLTLSITFAGSQPQTVISVDEPLTIEQEN